jgi:hypothetical protein
MLTFQFYVKLQASLSVNSSHIELINEKKLFINKLGQWLINNLQLGLLHCLIPY